jgi:hypothetical protein
LKIQIKDIEPNPFRDIKNYPIEEKRIQGLMNSIKETGFWDNMPARKAGNKYQIAYGHHRLEALKRLKIKEIEAVVKIIKDENMIKIMANENDELWGLNPKVDDETVRVAKKFLEKNLEIAKKYLKEKGTIPPDGGIGRDIIFRFLGQNWYLQRVERSLERLKLYDEGTLSRQAINKLPTDGTARSFVKAVKEVKPDLETQEKVANQIAEADRSAGLASPSAIENELLQEKLLKEGIISEKKKADKTKDFIEYINECRQAITSASAKLIKLLEYKKEFDSDFYQKTFERYDFITSAKIIIQRLQRLIGENNDKEKRPAALPGSKK